MHHMGKMEHCQIHVGHSEVHCFQSVRRPIFSLSMLENIVESLQGISKVLGLHCDSLQNPVQPFLLFLIHFSLPSLPSLSWVCLHTSNKHTYGVGPQIFWNNGFIVNFPSMQQGFFISQKCFFSGSPNLQLANHHLPAGCRGEEKSSKLPHCYL